MAKKTLEEFFASYGATKKLVENLKANMDVFCADMPPDERRALMRLNLIMIRQCLEDFGVDQ
jgi:hypothetical protein